MSDTFTANLKLQWPPVGQRSWNNEMQADLSLLDGMAALGPLAVTPHEIPSASLDVDVAAGSFYSALGVLVSYAGVTSVAMTASTTNYVYLTDSGTLTHNTTGFPTVANIVPLATVVAGSSTITTVTDSRVYLDSQGAARSSVQLQFLVAPTESPSASLNVSVAAGNFINAAGVTTAYAGTPSHTLSASATTFLWLTDAGVLTTGSSFPASTNLVPLASVVTAGSTVSSITDLRTIFPSHGAAPAASGTVTSVGLALPATFTVSGSPVTGSGTLTATYANQSANVFLAGPGSGSAATPTWRAIVAADMPAFVASGGSHASGAVPDPGSSAGTTRYLREDATWQAPPSSPTLTLGETSPGAYPYTVLSTDSVVLVNTSAARSIVLPTGASAGAGRLYALKDVTGSASTNAITVTVTGGGTIDGSSSAVLATDFGYWPFISNGTNWLSAYNQADVVGGSVRISGNLRVDGCLIMTPRSGAWVGSPYTLDSTETLQTTVSSSSTSSTANLPAANTLDAGTTILLKDTGGGAAIRPISVTPNGMDTIDGVNAAVKIQQNYGWVWLASNGINGWMLISSSGVARTYQQINSVWGAVNTATFGSSVNFDCTLGTNHTLTLGPANPVLAPINDSDGQQFTITLVQDSSGSCPVTWWSGIKWPGGSAPTLTSTANKADIFGFRRISSGSYYGWTIGQNF